MPPWLSRQHRWAHQWQRSPLTDTYSYNAFGGVRERTGTNTQPFQYVGNFYDADSKLYDFHARLAHTFVAQEVLRRCS